MSGVDTENKRRSVYQVPGITLPPVPDGTIAVLDRMQASWLYGGITPETAAAWTSIIFQGFDAISGKVVIMRGKYKEV